MLVFHSDSLSLSVSMLFWGAGEKGQLVGRIVGKIVEISGVTVSTFIGFCMCKVWHTCVRVHMIVWATGKSEHVIWLLQNKWHGLSLTYRRKSTDIYGQWKREEEMLHPSIGLCIWQGFSLYLPTVTADIDKSAWNTQSVNCRKPGPDIHIRIHTKLLNVSKFANTVNELWRLSA